MYRDQEAMCLVTCDVDSKGLLPASQPTLYEKPFPDPDSGKQHTASQHLPPDSFITSFPSSSSGEDEKRGGRKERQAMKRRERAKEKDQLTEITS